jgi:hypothetical protein
MTAIAVILAALFSGPQPQPPHRAHIASPRVSAGTALSHASRNHGYAQTQDSGVAAPPALEREHRRLVAYLRQQIRNK